MPLTWLGCGDIDKLLCYPELGYPYEKSHSTARDAGRVAHELGASHLILYHTEDDHLDTRRQRYADEAAQEYKGGIVVPDDGDVIDL